MRLTQWMIILLIAIGGAWFYQWLKQEGEDTRVCEAEARKNCVAKGYQWDEDGNRCLITDYYL